MRVGRGSSGGRCQAFSKWSAVGRLSFRLALVGTLAVSLSALATEPARPSGEAFRDGMIAGTWTSANKQVFGTAYEAYDGSGAYSDSSPTAPISRVWYTGGTGILNEVFWPSVDTPQTVDGQFLVSDGKSFFEERKDSQTEVQWVRPGVPIYQVTNSDPQGRFAIEKTIFSDPDRDVMIQHLRITRNAPGLHFYYLHKPAAGGTLDGNSARVSTGEGLPAGLYAWKGNQAQAVIFSVPLKQASAGFSGASDGWQDLHKNLAMSWSFETATNGNVTDTAWLDLPEEPGTTELDIAIGFAEDPAQASGLATASLQAGTEALAGKFIEQWEGYQGTLLDVSGASQDQGRLFRASAAVLKSSEDKTHAGAFVASPTVPWGNHFNNASKLPNAHEGQTGGYHLVWPRDLYEMATAFLAVNDTGSALAALNFLRSVQLTAADGAWSYGSRTHSKDGAFAQNTWTTGEPSWSGLQMDEVAMPVALAYRLWKGGAIQAGDYWDMVRRASDFLADYGPWSPMERWEETLGASPSTIASEIAALRGAADIAAAMQDTARAQRYRGTADAWASKPGDNIETWTVTTSGGFGNGHYYIREAGAASYDEAWNPNSEQVFSLANGAGQYREKDVLDGGFLELVRFNVKPALDPAIQSTIPVYEQQVGVDVPGIGWGFHRYNHDRYNYDDLTGNQTDGMLWPLLTGERGQFELERAAESRQDPRQAAAPYVATMEKMATPQLFLPEQVWQDGPGAGKPTGSATPLGWSHAEYLRLLRSVSDGAVFDRNSLPAQ